MKNLFMRWLTFKNEPKKEDIKLSPIYKISKIKIKDNPEIKSWEVTNEFLILRIPIKNSLIMEYHISLKELKDTLEKI